MCSWSIEWILNGKMTPSASIWNLISLKIDLFYLFYFFVFWISNDKRWIRILYFCTLGLKFTKSLASNSTHKGFPIIPRLCPTFTIFSELFGQYCSIFKSSCTICLNIMKPPWSTCICQEQWIVSSVWQGFVVWEILLWQTKWTSYFS
jgi:hypothetical protein